MTEIAPIIPTPSTYIRPEHNPGSTEEFAAAQAAPPREQPTGLPGVTIQQVEDMNRQLGYVPPVQPTIPNNPTRPGDHPFRI